MNNEWFDVAWVNFTKAILHGQMIADDGSEIMVDQVLTDDQREQLYTLNARHEAEQQKLLKSFVGETQ